MRFQKFINEALKPSQFRMYVKGWNKEYLKELFDGKYRIYLEMNQVRQENPPESDIQKRVARQLAPDFYIENYVAGLCKKKGDDKNLYKIGKVLNKIVELGSSLPDRFANDPIRQANKKTSIMVVISRHPYDIAGMSTDRGWTSCMALPGDKIQPKGGERCEYVEGEIKDGAIIAYLVNKNDPNITKPIARMLLKSYYNEDDPSKKILVSGPVYGTDINGFTETVDAWLKNQTKEEGLYYIGDNSYKDSGVHSRLFIGEDFVKAINNTLKNKTYVDFYILLGTTIKDICNEMIGEFGLDNAIEEIENTNIKKYIISNISSNIPYEKYKNITKVLLNAKLPIHKLIPDMYSIIFEYSYIPNLIKLFIEFSYSNMLPKEKDSIRKFKAQLEAFMSVNKISISEKRINKIIEEFTNTYLEVK